MPCSISLARLSFGILLGQSPTGSRASITITEGLDVTNETNDRSGPRRRRSRGSPPAEAQSFQNLGHGLLRQRISSPRQSVGPTLIQVGAAETLLADATRFAAAAGAADVMCP
jgi:hypothetical protein